MHPGSGFDDETSINDLVNALNPGRFAAESCRHWMHQPDPHANLRRVIDGGGIQGLARP